MNKQQPTTKPLPTFTPRRNKGKEGPKFKRWSREEIIADTALGYYRNKVFLTHLECWRLLDIEKKLESLLDWASWRGNSEQKAEIRQALTDVREEIKLSSFRLKVAMQSLRYIRLGKVKKAPPTKAWLVKRKKALIEADRKAVANYYKKSA